MSVRRRTANVANLDEEEQADVMVPVVPTHEFLKFSARGWSTSNKKDFKVNRTENLKKPIRASEYVSWDTLSMIHSGGEGAPKGDQEMNNLLKMEYHDEDGDLVFVSHAWARLFQIHEPLYREMIYEFMCTFLFEHNWTELHREKTIRFQLCGVAHSMSLVEFAVAVGLYTAEEVYENGFDEHLGAGLRTIADFDDVAPEWGSIANEVFDKSGVSDRAIRDPRHRVIHRMISNSITGRRESIERVTVPDLFYLNAIVKGHLVNLPYLLARFFKYNATGRKKESSICGGHIVSRIARNLGLMTGVNKGKCSEVIPGMRELSAQKMLRMGVIVRMQLSYHHGDYFWAPTTDTVPLGEPGARAELGGRQRRPLEQRMVALEEEVHELRDEFRESELETRRSESFVRGMMCDLFSNLHMDYTDYAGQRHSFEGQHRYFPQESQPPPQYYPQHPPQYPPQYPSPYGPRYPTFPPPRVDFPGETSQQGGGSQSGWDSYAEGYARGGSRGRHDDAP